MVGAELFGADLGQRIHLQLADGTPVHPKVVAIYGNGLGFGDITLPRDLLLAHGLNDLDDIVLVKAEAQTAGAALADIARDSLGVRVQDRDGFKRRAAGADRDAGNTHHGCWPSPLCSSSSQR